jgi:putative phosphoesterase
MKILVISDIHENFDNLVRIFQEIQDKNIEQVICLWDLINNWIAKTIVAHWYPCHLIWWNNDGEVVNVTKTFVQSWNTVAETVFDAVEFWGRKIFLSHYANIAKSMAKSWDFDAVFYWHNHIKHTEKIWNCFVLNPWEVWWHKTACSTYAIYDTETNSADIFELANPSICKSKTTGEYIKSLKFEFSQTAWHQF